MKKILKTFKNINFLLFCLLDVICSRMKIRITPLQRVDSSWLSRIIISLYVSHVYGPEKIKVDSCELVVLCVVRDGQSLIREFIEYYFRLGVKHIVFLDNGSLDKTVSIASQYRNVSILESELPYKTYAIAFKHYLISRFGKDNWCLCVDIDEYFDYPYSSSVSLFSLLQYLNINSYNNVVCQMLDMFSDKNISLVKDQNVRNTNSYYDIFQIRKSELKGNNLISNKNIKFYYDGIRLEIFGTDNIYLTKYALMKTGKTLSPDRYKVHYFEKNARLADFSCVLYHYKFTKSFFKKCQIAVNDLNYWNDSSQYKKYIKILNDEPNLNFKEKSLHPRKLNKVNDLVEDNFLQVSGNYQRWVRKK